MKVDELIKQKAEELHRVHIHDSGRLGELTAKARRHRRSQVGVLIGAALAVLLLFGPVAWFFRSEDPTSSIPDANTVTASTDPDSTPTGSSGSVSIGERLFEMPGDGGLGRIMSSGSDLIVTGWDIVLRSANGGGSWEVTGNAPPGDDSLILTEAAEGILLAVGAHDGASARLYRSADYGATWEQIELPAPPEVVQVVPGVIAYRAGEWLISGVGTQSSFDTDATLYLWRSPDAVNWESEEVADLQGRFAYSESVDVVDGSLVIISRIAQDTEVELLAFEETSDGWSHTELTPILATQAGLTPEFVNALLKGSGIVGDRLHTWWSFDDGSGGMQLAAMAYRTGPGQWGAETLSGVVPETVTVTQEGLVGTAHPGTLAPMLTPGFTAIVASSDGITWSGIGRADGLYLRQLHPLDDRRLAAAGNETEATQEGFTVPSSGIWEVTLSGDLADIVVSP